MVASTVAHGWRPPWPVGYAPPWSSAVSLGLQQALGRDFSAFPCRRKDLEELLLAVVAGGLAGLVVYSYLTSRSYRRRLALVEQLAANLRSKPDRQALLQKRS